MSRLRRTALGLAAACILGLSAALPAQAATIHVHAGQSIQAAIDAAKPGDSITVDPGVYQENLTITKDGIHLKGGGIGKTILEPGAAGTGVCVDPSDPSSVNGICVLGNVDSSFNAIPPAVNGTTIEGFTIRNFPGFGVFVYNAADIRVERVEAAGNGGYGISGFVLQHVTFSHDIASGNGEPGFYIGDSPTARAQVDHNVANGNGAGGEEGDGILIRDSSTGSVDHNTVWGNCVGINVVDSPEDPIPATNWHVDHNKVTANNAACAGEPGGAPPLSGIGIFVAGGSRVRVDHNDVGGNGPSAGGPFPSGGIVMLSTAGIGGADPTNNTIEHNKATGNTPWDVFWDGSGSGNRFSHNKCGTSSPGSICH